MRKVVGICVLITIITCVGCKDKSTNQAVAHPTLQKELSLEEKYGVDIVGIYQSAAGYMLDFRYKITDPEKAKPLFSREDKPYLIDQASGAKMLVPAPPKVGPLRQSNIVPQKGRTYFIIFGNPGKYIKPGTKVTVVVGEFHAQDLIVQK